MPGRGKRKYTSRFFHGGINFDGKNITIETPIPLTVDDVPEHDEFKLPCGCGDGIYERCDWTCLCSYCHDQSVHIGHEPYCVHDATKKHAQPVAGCICPCHSKTRPHLADAI